MKKKEKHAFALGTHLSFEWNGRKPKIIVRIHMPKMPTIFSVRASSASIVASV